MLEIKDFIKTVLIEIADGVSEASKEIDAKNTGVKVSPASEDLKFDHNVQKVDFDIGVTVVEKEGSDAKAKISVMGIGLGGGLEAKTESSSVSRIKFSIPLGLPAYIPKKEPARSITRPLTSDFM